MKVAAIILAAGGSARMPGKNKLLLPLDGEVMITRVCDAVLASRFSPVCLVTGHDRHKVEQAVGQRGVEFIYNAHWKTGMSSSIQAGLAALPGNTRGALIALGDMPLVRARTLLALRSAFEDAAGERLVYPAFEGRQGNPVLIPRKYFTELDALSGNRDGKILLERHSDETIAVAVSTSSVIVDFDSEEAYRNMISAGKGGSIASA